MGFSWKPSHPVPDLKKSLEKIDQSMKDSVIDVAKKWVLKASANTPVLTGASKASFLKLAWAAKITLSITPRIQSRIPLGIGTSTGSVFFTRGIRYGFEWSSGLDYINIVERHSKFLDAAEPVLREKAPFLPQPFITYTGRS